MSKKLFTILTLSIITPAAFCTIGGFTFFIMMFNDSGADLQPFFNYETLFGLIILGIDIWGMFSKFDLARVIIFGLNVLLFIGPMLYIILMLVTH